MYESGKQENGQVIILLALGIVALIGFVALAIDGGMVLSDRRFVQAASDAAAMSGAGSASLYLENAHIRTSNFNCSEYHVQYAEYIAKVYAIQQASANGFTIDHLIDDQHGVDTVCNDGLFDMHIDVITQMTMDTETSFIHVLYDGPARNTVEAITRIYPRTPIGFGHAIVGLDPKDCLGHQNGVMFSGNIEVLIDGGGVFSNGCLRGNGSSLIVDVDNGNVRYVEDLECDPNGCPGFDPKPDHISTPLPEASYQVPPPDCSGLPIMGEVKKGGTLNPGVYTSIRVSSSNDTLTLNPGLYCLTGSPNAMVLTGGTINADGVTIYSINGEIQISGNANVYMKAPDAIPDPDPAIPGILIYLAEGNTGAVELEGNSDSSFIGTIYAPDGFIEAKGTSGTHPTFHTQFIGYDVEVTGNANIDIVYNEDYGYSFPTHLDFEK